MFFAIIATGTLLGLFLGLTVYRCRKPASPNATLVTRELDRLSAPFSESPERDPLLADHTAAGR